MKRHLSLEAETSLEEATLQLPPVRVLLPLFPDGSTGVESSAVTKRQRLNVRAAHKQTRKLKAPPNTCGRNTQKIAYTEKVPPKR